eukprot:7224414-Alexandrium_andersonii.AAC.1
MRRTKLPRGWLSDMWAEGLLLAPVQVSLRGRPLAWRAERAPRVPGTPRPCHLWILGALSCGARW